MQGFSGRDIQRLRVAEEQIVKVLDNKRMRGRLKNTTQLLADIQSALEDVMRNEGRSTRIISRSGLSQSFTKRTRKNRTKF